MDEHFIKIHKWLYPASWLYGAVVMMRNKQHNKKKKKKKTL